MPTVSVQYSALLLDDGRLLSCQSLARGALYSQHQDGATWPETDVLALV